MVSSCGSKSNNNDDCPTHSVEEESMKEALHDEEDEDGFTNTIIDCRDHSSVGSLGTEEILRSINNIRGDGTDLGSFPLCGRVEEARRIREAYLRAKAGPSEIVLIHGEPGIGKSFLSETALRELCMPPEGSLTGFYVTAKYNQLAVNRAPYSAIHSCLTDLVDLLQQEPCHRDAIRKALDEKFTLDDLKLLTTLISNLGHLTGEAYHRNMDEPLLQPVHNKTGTATRFKALCGDFLKLVATLLPVVFVLDDIHWADEESLQLLISLIKDSTSRHILFVLTSRENEAEVTCMRLLRDLLTLLQNRGTETTSVLASTDIQLVNLSTDSIQEIVRHFTKCEDSARTYALSEVILQKTLGNPFFVVQYLDRLQQAGFLNKSAPPLSAGPQKGGAIWDVDHIRAETSISDNVLELLRQKMGVLPPPFQRILQIAAFIGRSFGFSQLMSVALSKKESDVLLRQLEEVIRSDIHSTNLRLLVQKVVLEAISLGFLQGHNETIVFTHDQIQLSFYTMVPERERSLVHLNIGRVLKTLPNTSPFAVADQMNKGLEHVSAPEERLELAHINCRAGHSALLRNALQSAADYLYVSFELVNVPQLWDLKYAITLDLCSIAIEYLSAAGRLEPCVFLYSRISEKAAFEDTLRARTALIRIYHDVGWATEAVRIGLETMGRLGEPAIVDSEEAYSNELAATAAALREKDDYALAKMPRMTDAGVLAKVSIMGMTTKAAHVAQREVLAFILTLRCVRLSIVYGATDCIPYSFGCLGIAVARQNLFDDCFRFGQIALELDKAQLDREGTPWCALIVAGFIIHWKQPIKDLLEYYGEGFEIGLATGNVTPGMLCGFQHCIVSLSVGKPIKQVLRELGQLAVHAGQHNQEMVKGMLLSLQRDTMMFLRVEDDDEDASPRGDEADDETTLSLPLRMKLKVACFFHDWRRAERLTARLKRASAESLMTMHFSILEEILLTGVLNFELAKSSTTNREKHEAMKALETMSSFAQAGCPDAVPMLRFLEAEAAALSKQPATVVADAYEKAIQQFHEGGLIHYEAFAYERSGLFHQQMNDVCSALELFTYAMDFWKDWEATAKIDQLYILTDAMNQQLS